MGLVANILEWFRDEDGDAKFPHGRLELGGRDDLTGHQYQGAGMDSGPLKGDYALLVPGPEAGTYVIAGYIDPINAGTAKGGETRLYARNEDGKVVASLMLNQDGEVHLGEDLGESLIARADRVDDELIKIKDLLENHTHPQWACSGGDSSPVTGAQTTSKPTQVYDRKATGCDKVHGT